MDEVLQHLVKGGQLMVRLYWWLRVILLSVRWIPRLNLGDLVRYRGKVYTLNQGVANPLWDLLRGDEYLKYVHRKHFRKLRTFVNYAQSFLSGYSFYLGYWYDIWVDQGIKPWMRGCNIWARR